MKPKVFISYSRRQTPFVDAFVDQLEDGGYSVWLDYQSLVLAQPWFEQIKKGFCMCVQGGGCIFHRAQISQTRAERGKSLYTTNGLFVLCSVDP